MVDRKLAYMRTIKFHKSASGECPIREFLEKLNGKEAQKVTWVLQLIRDTNRPTTKFFKKLRGVDLWEVRVEYFGKAFRLLGFFADADSLILTSGFVKKSDKIPSREIEAAQKRRMHYFPGKG